MAISDWPELERPREKLQKFGASVLSDAELLAIFLRTGVAGKTAVDIARDLISASGGLRELLDWEQDVFCQQRGLGPAKYVQLQATLELGKRYLAETLVKGSALGSSTETIQYFTARLRAYSYEVFAALFLDNQHRVLHYEEIFRGTIDGASVHPREVVKLALKTNAAAVIFAHNHPSGVAEPSQSDHRITERLVAALALVDIRVVDHIIIGDGEATSFAQHGFL
ncbi:MAG: DNA repair protein RadC [Pseudomonadales bacterium]|nr:DNA repair protein RadC [Pseudomonadales bacterium]MBL4867640.1 DNA repair protein RadC [Pseudomonadales bacterium]